MVCKWILCTDNEKALLNVLFSYNKCMTEGWNSFVKSQFPKNCPLLSVSLGLHFCTVILYHAVVEMFWPYPGAKQHFGKIALENDCPPGMWILSRCISFPFCCGLNHTA